MTPSSDVLETYFDTLQEIDDKLGKVGKAEVTDPGLIQELAELSKSWLRLSESLRSAEFIDGAGIDTVNGTMQDVLASTNKRSRANTYRRKLAPVIEGFLDQFVVPLIRFEGSPSQVAGRQLVSTFESLLDPDEAKYVDEAARCLATKCYRASIILLWAAAIARMHSAIEIMGYKAYNSALDITLAKKGNPFNRVSKSGHITSLPELQRARDFDLIAVGMELWSYDLQTFEELERLLGIRNSAAHPGMSTPATLDVQHFASKVSTCVFSRIKPTP